MYQGSINSGSETSRFFISQHSQGERESPKSEYNLIWCEWKYTQTTFRLGVYVMPYAMFLALSLCRFIPMFRPIYLGIIIIFLCVLFSLCLIFSLVAHSRISYMCFPIVSLAMGETFFGVFFFCFHFFSHFDSIETATYMWITLLV